MNLELEKKNKVLERLADIDRIKKSIQKQDDAIQKIKEQIKQMESK
jgi:hypothetical protein